MFPLKPATMAKCVILVVVVLAASVVTNWAAMYVSERNSRGMPPPPLPQLPGDSEHGALPAMSLDLDLTLAGSIMGWDIRSVHTGELGAETFQRLLGEGVNVDEQSPGGTTALEFACAFGNFRAAETLLASGARTELGDHQGTTPLIAAASAGETHIVQLLLDCGARVDGARVDTHRNSQTPLITAAAHGHAQVVALLLFGGGDPHVRDTRGRTSVHWAAAHGHLEVLRTLLASFGSKAPPARLLEARDGDGATALHLAVASGHHASATVLLMAGARTTTRVLIDAELPPEWISVTANGASALELAGDDRMRSILHRAAAREVMLDARDGGSPSCVTTCTAPPSRRVASDFAARTAGPVAAGSSQDDRSPPPSRDESWVELMLGSGREDEEAGTADAAAELKALNRASPQSGLSALHDAVLRKAPYFDGGPAAAARLLGRGVDPDTVAGKGEYDGETALTMAVRAQDHEVVKLLVDFAANVNHRGASSTALTPLLAAVERGNLDLVELLISRGADVRVPDRQGRTPMARAAAAAAESPQHAAVLKVLRRRVGSWELV